MNKLANVPFKVDLDFLNETKTRQVIRYKGTDFLAVYIYLLTLIFNESYYIEVTKSLIFEISDKLDKSEEEIESFINFCVELDIFDQSIYTHYNIITSEDLQERFKKATRKIDIAEFSLIGKAKFEAKQKAEEFERLRNIEISFEKNLQNTDKNSISTTTLTQKEEQNEKSNQIDTTTTYYNNIYKYNINNSSSISSSISSSSENLKSDLLENQKNEKTNNENQEKAKNEQRNVFQEIIDHWNERVRDDLKIKYLTKEKRVNIQNRLREFKGNTQEEKIEFAKKLIERVTSNDFIMGTSDKSIGWVGNFNWLFKSENHWKEVENGKYDPYVLDTELEDDTQEEIIDSEQELRLREENRRRFESYGFSFDEQGNMIFPEDTERG